MLISKHQDGVVSSPRIYILTRDKSICHQVEITLRKMSFKAIVYWRPTRTLSCMTWWNSSYKIHLLFLREHSVQTISKHRVWTLNPVRNRFSQLRWARLDSHRIDPIRVSQQTSSRPRRWVTSSLLTRNKVLSVRSSDWKISYKRLE